MLNDLIQKLSHLPGILQGAIGSALFWIVLKALEFVAVSFLRFAGRTTAVINRQMKFREYIYRRFTSRSGLVNYVQGFQYVMSRAFTGLLTGLVFCCLALLLGGSSQVIWGVCLVAALVYFGTALTWLVPRGSWKNDSDLVNWQRIADLENELCGQVEKTTTDMLAKFTHAEAHPEKEAADAER